MKNDTISQVNMLSQSNPTVETAFAALAPYGTTPTVRATVQLNPATSWDPTSAAQTQLANATLFDGRPFKVRAAVKATGGGAGNVTLNVYANLGGNTNLTTFTNDVKVLSTGAIATAGAAITAYVEGIFIWDSTSRQLAGVQGLCINNIGTPAVLNSGAFTVTSTNPVKTSLALSGNIQFYATALFGTSNAGNTVTLTELSIEVY